MIATRKVSFLPTAEQKVEAGPERSNVMTSDDVAAVRDLQDARNGLRHDPDYAARNRAETLASMEVTRDFSPSERLTIHTPDGWPFAYHWCEDQHRDRVGMGPWVAMDADKDWDEVMKICPSKTVQKKDGRIVAGDLFLAKAPIGIVEKMRALHYQRSLRNLDAAVGGSSSAQTRSGGKAMPGFESFDSMNRSTSRAGDGGVSMSGTLKDDPSV